MSRARSLPMGLPAAHFAVETLFVPDLSDLPRDQIVSDLIRARHRLAEARPDWPGEFGFLMVDGLSLERGRAGLFASDGPGPGADVRRLGRGRAALWRDLRAVMAGRCTATPRS